MYKNIISQKIDNLIEKLKKLKKDNNIMSINIETTPEEYLFSYNGAIGKYDTIITFHHETSYNENEAEKIKNIFL